MEQIRIQDSDLKREWRSLERGLGEVGTVVLESFGLLATTVGRTRGSGQAKEVEEVLDQIAQALQEWQQHSRPEVCYRLRGHAVHD